MKKNRTKILLLLFMGIYAMPSLKAQPVKVWSTYVGEGYNAFNSTPKIGTTISNLLYEKGYLYIAGTTTDTSYIATSGTFKPAKNPGDFAHSFLAKFDTLGNRIWGTYWGGNAPYVDDITLFSNITFQPHIAIDPDGNIFMAGFTTCTQGISTPGTFQPVFTPGALLNGYLAKFSNTGQRLWCTYLPDRVADIACDNGGNVYLIGGSHINGQGTPGTHQPSPAPGLCDTFPTNDAYILKFSNNGQRLWGTYYGGNSNDNGYCIAVAPNGDLLIGGSTVSNNGIATPGTYQDTSNVTGCYDALRGFIARFSSSNGQRIWGTYFGDNTGGPGTTPLRILYNKEQAGFFVGGYTPPADGLTTTGVYQPQYGGGTGDAFLARFTDNGQLVWGTYYGGPGTEFVQDGLSGPFNAGLVNLAGLGLSLTADNNILMIGATTSQGLNTPCFYDQPASSIGFMAKMTQDGQRIWGTYNDASAGVCAIAAGKGNVFYTGLGTTQSGRATQGAWRTAKLHDELAGLLTKYRDDFTCPDRTITITVSDSLLQTDPGMLHYQWYKDGSLLSGAGSFRYTLTDSGRYYVLVTDSCGCSYTSDSVNAGPHHSGTGISIIDEMSLSLFPNPVSGYFILRGHNRGGHTMTMNLELADITGRSVWHTSVKNVGASFEQRFDIGSLPPGIYTLKLYTGEGTGIIKLVRQ